MQPSILKNTWIKNLSYSLVCLFSTSTLLAAESDYDYHPILSDSFVVTLGAFVSDQSFKISAETNLGPEFEQDIDFGNALGVDKKSTLFNTQIRWKFGEQQKWSLWGQYFKASSSGTATLKEDIQWQDLFLGKGSAVKAGADLAITRIFIGRSFYKNQQHDFGVGLGAHILNLGAFIEGDFIFEDGTDEFKRAKASSSQPLPNLGSWYKYSPAKNWLLHSRVDWISANIGDYDGSFWNVVAGVNYQAFRHVGFDLSYQFFKIDLNVNKDNWHGRVNLEYKGPLLSVTGNW